MVLPLVRAERSGAEEVMEQQPLSRLPSPTCVEEREGGGGEGSRGVA